jgi:hypothetical protein
MPTKLLTKAGGSVASYHISHSGFRAGYQSAAQTLFPQQCHFGCATKVCVVGRAMPSMHAFEEDVDDRGREGLGVGLVK